MNVIVLGGTAGIGREVARQCAERGFHVTLFGRNPDSLERSAGDLHIRGARDRVETVHCDLRDPGTFGNAWDAAEQAVDRVDTVVVSAAVLAPQQRMEECPPCAAEVLQVDFTNTLLFCEEARRRLLAKGGGTLCVLSSVAGDRARKRVILYGAAKAGLSYYLDGLDHKFRSAGLVTICVKPGFIRTGMTDGLSTPLFGADPDAVARVIMKAIDRGRPQVYAPRLWKWIMLVVKAMPRFVMRRCGF